jgi:hypothetical protein
MHKHIHQQFICFLTRRTQASGRDPPCHLENYASYTRLEVRAWLISIRAGCSTLTLRSAPRTTRWRISFSGLTRRPLAVFLNRSLTSGPPSTDPLMSTMPTQSPSPGASQPPTSGPISNGSLYPPYSQCTGRSYACEAICLSRCARVRIFSVEIKPKVSNTI